MYKSMKSFLNKHPALKNAFIIGALSSSLYSAMSEINNGSGSDALTTSKVEVVESGLDLDTFKKECLSICDKADRLTFEKAYLNNGNPTGLLKYRVKSGGQMKHIIRYVNKYKSSSMGKITKKNFNDLPIGYDNSGIDFFSLQAGDVVYLTVDFFDVSLGLYNHYMLKNKALEDRDITDTYRYKHQHSFFDTNDFNTPLQKVEIDDGVTVIRDKGLTFYVVRPGDNLSKIRNKLSRIEEFSYLADDKYAPTRTNGRNITGFNIPSKSLESGFYLPIPLPDSQRLVSIKENYYWALRGIDEMEIHPLYGEETRSILTHITREDLATLIVAFARAETAQDQSTMSDAIGTVGYQRWEPHLSAYSFSPYHILMEKNKDGRTPGPGLKARINLQFTEGVVNHPRNGAMLLLAFFIEKNGNKHGWERYFPLQPGKAQERVLTKFYNGSSNYNGNPGKLGNNYNFIKSYLNNPNTKLY